MLGLKFNYDKDNDILYISIGEPRPSYGLEETEGIIIRRDLDTNELTGITIIDFKERLEDKSLFDLDLPIEVDFCKHIPHFLN